MTASGDWHRNKEQLKQGYLIIDRLENAKRFASFIIVA